MELSRVITGIGIGGYRSFWGPNMQFVGPIDHIHLVVGQNNSGKSNILRAVQQFLPTLSKTRGRSISGDDLPRGRGVNTDFRLGIAVDNASELLSITDKRHLARLDFLLESEPMRPNGSRDPWLILSGRGMNEVSHEFIEAVAKDYVRRLERLSPAAAREVSIAALVGQPNHSAAVSGLLNKMSSGLPNTQVETISAFREIRKSENPTYSGGGLIERLAHLENPGAANYDEDQELFREINKFVRTVLEDETAQLRVPATQDVLLVESHGQAFELASLGTGVHEVVILAAAATILRDHLVCIEEPEIHLHPLLQRRLITYLRTQHQNRYLIATHSAHFLDSNIASFSHVRLTTTQGSIIDAATHARQVAAIARDLGYRASDIVQSNAIVWVEGPSDRVFINGWIKAWDSELIEGVHYSVMFYGGRLLSHLSIDDDEIQEFIDLRRINRNMVVVIDSDRREPRKRINSTKRRIKAAFDDQAESEGFAWITQGREIENYVPKDMWREAYKLVHPTVDPTWNGGQYTDAFAARKKLVSPRKVKIAEKIVQKWTTATEHPLDLADRMKRLSTFIRAANDLPPKVFPRRL